MSYKEKAQDIYNHLAQGKLLDAFDKYYDENVVMEEVGEDPRVGKQLNREYEEKFLSSVEEFFGMGVDAILSDEENAITMVESWMDVKMKGMDRFTMKQVAVQKWKDGKIVHEKFYHN